MDYFSRDGARRASASNNIWIHILQQQCDQEVNGLRELKELEYWNSPLLVGCYAVLGMSLSL